MKYICIVAFLFLETVALLFPADNRIPDCLVCYQFGPEQFILIVEKSTQQLLVYSNYKSDPIQRFTITSGKNSGQKTKEGDMKTPEGIYFCQRILTGEELPKTEDYGEKAFTLNFPNPIDQRENREGSGIWLHGAFNSDKTNSPNNSRGCVVVRNGDLAKLSKFIYLNQTPVCIYDKIKYTTADALKQKREHLVNSLKNWKESWESKNIDAYIKYYDDRFSMGNMNRSQYKVYKDNLNKTYTFIKVFLSNINIYAFDNYYVFSFNQFYISDKNQFYNRKIQYWKEYPGMGKIADEFSFALPSPGKIEIDGKMLTVDQIRRGEFALPVQSSPAKSMFTPHTVYLAKLSVTEPSVTLQLQYADAGKRIKIVPVLRWEENNNSHYSTIPDIALKDGIPQNYGGAVSLQKGQTQISVKSKKGGSLKSLTLFVVNDSEQIEQIITYFVNSWS